MSLYHEAAEILCSPSNTGGSLKTRIFGRNHSTLPRQSEKAGGGHGSHASSGKVSPAQLYALVVETRKWSPVLKEIIERSDILKLERKLTPALSLLLVHDFLLARGGIALPQNHGLRTTIEKYKGRLTSELTLARLRRKAASVDALKIQIDKTSAGEEAHYPRWVRINVLKSSLEDELEATFAKYDRARSIQDVITKEQRHVFIDPHIPNLIAVTPGTDLTKTQAYAAGKLILQDKASCFPAYLLDPRVEDGDVIDACSAPGNKTTHLAAILHGHRSELNSESQTIYAFEKDSRRARTLEKMVNLAGSKKVTRIGFGQDFLQVDPLSEKFRDVGALLLDPSCSGSGIVGRDSIPDLFLPETTPSLQGSKADPNVIQANKRKRKHVDSGEINPNIIRDDDGNEVEMKSEKDLESRLEALAAFQLTLILHAFQFPKAKRITYSTCSVHSQENEEVVMKALQSEIAKKKGWRILQRRDQVIGLRDWAVRGLVEACEGNAEIADGCIRSYKGDGRGVMGFFVAGFVRDSIMGDGSSTASAIDVDDNGPYMRDETGRIIRDVLGMPVLKSTGIPVSLHGINDDDDAEDEDDESDESEDGSSEVDSDDDEDGDDNDAANAVTTGRHEKDIPRSDSIKGKLDKKLHREGKDDRQAHDDEEEWQGVSD